MEVLEVLLEPSVFPNSRATNSAPITMLSMVATIVNPPSAFSDFPMHPQPMIDRLLVLIMVSTTRSPPHQLVRLISRNAG
jgi:hypothetical protein